MASVELGLAPEAAWAVVMDWERQSRWMLFTRVWATENGGTGVGGGVAARTSVGGVGFTDDMVITHWDPPRECTVKHLGKLIRGTGTFTIEPREYGGRVGSRFTWAEDVVPPLGRVGVLCWPVVRPVFEGLMRVSLRRLVEEVR
ncbi:SRPBCC family protein [Kribbella sp.]|uniref:SRPBCC family protein n=1 Tax=Kribbella sp. TaxID=1871183 RepID=UPI002D508E84|nr:SRPBCC family protein [Kribbella sp.]HZX02185.1 SRPBCC family protein [Kribbella sp.]